MKTAILSILASAGLLLPATGCVSGGNVAKALHELAHDPAMVDAKIITPWGSAEIHRQVPVLGPGQTMPGMITNSPPATTPPPTGRVK